MAEQIRGLLSSDKELGELKRDLQAALDDIPRLKRLRWEGSYVEPIYLKLSFKPEGVLLINCIDARYQEEADRVLGGTACHATWEPQRSRVRINSIDGFTPDPSQVFRMTFLAVG